MTIQESTKKEIEQYWAQDLETLYSIIDLISSSEKTVQYLPGNEIVRGIAKFKELTPILKKKVCVEWDFCGKKDNSGIQDTITLIAEIADIIAAPSLGFPPTLIATILAKKGLSAFCHCEEKHNGND